MIWEGDCRRVYGEGRKGVCSYIQFKRTPPPFPEEPGGRPCGEPEFRNLEIKFLLNWLNTSKSIKLKRSYVPPLPPSEESGSRPCGVQGLLCVDWGLGMGVPDLRLGSWGYGQCGVQGYLAYKKPPPPRTVQYDNAKGPVGVLGG